MTKKEAIDFLKNLPREERLEAIRALNDDLERDAPDAPPPKLAVVPPHERRGWPDYNPPQPSPTGDVEADRKAFHEWVEQVWSPEAFSAMLRDAGTARDKDGATDVSENKSKYLADAILESRE